MDWLLGMIALLIFLLNVSVGEVDQAQLTAACEGHQGVQQVVPTSWVAIDGANSVVCKDGTVRKVS